MKTLLAALCVIFIGGLAIADGQTATNATVTNSVSSQIDPIDKLVADLSTHGQWWNGRFVPIHLPETASPEQVVEQIFQKTGFYQSGRLTDYKVLTSRQVCIDKGKYIAALVQTNLGKKIVLFTAGGQWNRVYEVKPSA